jgi:hypothetical protein
VEKLFDIFAKHTAKTGSLDAETFKKVLHSEDMKQVMIKVSFDPSLNRPQMEDSGALFRAFDADGSGAVDFIEFAMACYVFDSHDTEEKMKVRSAGHPNYGFARDSFSFLLFHGFKIRSLLSK